MIACVLSHLHIFFLVVELVPNHLLDMNHLEDLVHAYSPMLQQDVVGIVASFLDVFDLRRTFIRVSKLWFAIGMDIVNGNWCEHLFGFRGY